MAENNSNSKRSCSVSESTTESGETDEEPEDSSNSLFSLLTEPNTQMSLRDILEAEEEGENESSNKKPKRLSQELDRFRDDWKKEIAKNQTTASCSCSTKKRSKSPPLPWKKKVPQYSSPEENFEKAKFLFLRGVDFEQKGMMQDAIRFYTQAVHLVSDIENRVYLASVQKRSDRSISPGEKDDETTQSKDEELHDQDDLMEFFSRRTYENGIQKCCKKSELHDDNQLHFSDLPMETVFNILRYVVGSDLDLRQLEQLSQVCAGFYVLARCQLVWKLACYKTWGVKTGILDETYPSWREMYILRPHVWLTGVYISKITYVRHGETSFQDSFYRPWHLVVYYRYLRFYPNGSIVMLTSAEEPSNIVSLLRSKSPRHPGAIRGTYRLTGRDSVSAYLLKPAKTHSENYMVYPYSKRKQPLNPIDPVEHAFLLELKIQSTKRKKHTVLEWAKYECRVSLRNGKENSRD